MTDKGLSPTGFPTDAWEWLVALGGSDDENPTLTWQKAWRMANQVCQLQSPHRHLLRYLASCSHRQLRPSAVTWVRFVVDDEQREHREIEVEIGVRLRKQQEEETQRSAVDPSLAEWRKQWVGE